MSRIVSTERQEHYSLALKEVVAAHGTPVHILKLDKIDYNYSILKKAFADCVVPVDIFYSFKTNYLPTICQRMKELGAGADVVSEYELRLALDLCFRPNIILNGPFKTYNEIATAVRSHGLVNVDSLNDIDILNKIAKDCKTIIEVGLRVNPGRNVYERADQALDKNAQLRAQRSKFGWPIEGGDADRVAAQIEAGGNLKLKAIHCHLGSQITNTSAHIEALTHVIRYARHLRARYDISCVNIGGGFGVPGIRRYRGKDIANFGSVDSTPSPSRPAEVFDMYEMVNGINRAIERNNLTDINIACEPGRFLVSDAMQLVTTVVSVKRTSYGNWVVLDGGLNLLPTAGPLEEHSFEHLRESKGMMQYMVGGPLCYEQDVFSYAMQLPKDIRVGDIIVLKDSGAYSVSRSTNFIRPRAPVVALDSTGVPKLCWRRETFEDIFSFHVDVARTKTETEFGHAV